MSIRLPAATAVCFALACASNKPVIETPAAPPPVATEPAPTPAPPPPPPPKPEIGSFGFDTAGMDTSSPPGESFFRYANGKWLEVTEIPADRASYGMFSKLDDLSRMRTRTLIEDAAKADVDEGTDARKIGDLFAAFMDEAAIEAAGITPLKPEIDMIASIRSRSDLAHVLGTLQRSYTNTPFEMMVGPDDKQPDRYLASLWQSGLGLPDRDYYLKNDPELAKVRAKYQIHIANILRLAGVQQPERRAKGIYELEKNIARAHWNIVDSRDVDKTYNKWKRSDFDKRAPGVDWAAYFKADGLEGQTEIGVAQPSALIGMAKLVRSAPLSTWQDYLSFHLLKGGAAVLPAAFVDEDFDFDRRTLNGTPQLKERWKRGVDLVTASMGDAIGKLYVAKYFPPEAKARADVLVKNLVSAMAARLDALTWMEPETRAKAKAKLASFTPKIGYPDRWRDYGDLTIKRNELYASVQRASEFEFQRNLNKLGRPIDRGEWYMSPMQVNAYANPVMNEIVFPAAILQPPFFDAKADDAVNYGGIGAVIGHEMSHHFDDQGRKYDATGKLTDWWTPQDVERFKALTNQLVAQYAQYEPLPGVHVNGELTLGENIADLAGITIAYDAYHQALNGAEPPVIDGLTGDQRFFLGFAQVWRNKYRPETLRQQLLTNPHSPSEQRTSVVRNIDAWYEAFGATAGQALYTAPEARVRIW